MEKKKNNLRQKKVTTISVASNDFEVGSENIFADLGFPDPEEELAKAELALKIYRIIKEKKLTQVKAAALLGVDQAKVSALITGKLSGFSMERLFRFLNNLGHDIVIKVKPKSRTREKGGTTVGSYPRISGEINRGHLSKSSRAHAAHAKKRG